MSTRFLKAQRRLQRDLQELADRSWELPTVSALPLEDDILEWHCNIVGTGEHDGVVLHLKLLFPDTYPHQPPEVVLMSKVCHPHVFGDHLCMDMLEEGQWSDAQERDAEFTGWSTCYSVFSILMQLQAFIFDLGNNAHRTRTAASRCVCFCGHGLDRTYPPLPEPVAPPPRCPPAKSPFREEAEESTSAGDSLSAAEPEEVSGRVARVEPYGVFVSLEDGSTGLLHRSEMPRGKAFEEGERLTCRIKARSPKLSLTMRRSDGEIAAIVRAGERIPASVTGVRPFGAFVDFGGSTALLHRSEMDLLPQQRVPYQLGDGVRVRLLLGEDGRMAASAKALFLTPARPQALVDGTADLERLRCFHSKAVFTEAVLGVGVGLEVEEPAAPGATERYHLASIYDTLAYESFQDGVRKGVWKQRFSEFLPLAMDEAHFARAQRVLEASLARLSSGRIAEKTRSHGKSREERDAEYRARITLDEYRRGGAAALQAAAPPPSMGRATDAPFSPEMVLEVIPKLMNSQVVMMASGQLWRCEKALEGYYAYHHLLLHCLRAYPVLRTRVESRLAAFLENPDARVKSRVHNLGEFLCLVSVSDRFGWADLGIPFLEEAFDRNVLWILKQAPHLGEMTDAGLSIARLRRSFNANRVSLRLLMFQVAFLQLAKPPHAHQPGASSCRAASCALERKDRCKGLPCPGEVEWLFERCLRILAVEDFHEFLELVGAAPMDDLEICRWLRRSVLRSIGKDYHNPRVFRSLAAKAQASKSKADGPEDPEDFGMDSRPKESKAEKRARRRAVLALHATASAKNAEYQRALSWARFFTTSWAPRQAALIIEKNEIDRLESELDSENRLKSNFGRASKGFRLLDGAVLSKIKTFPATVWLGQGCKDCGRAVTVEVSGRCMSCCKDIAKRPETPQSIKGVSVKPGAPVAQFTAFQARAVTPVQWEVYMDVGFDGLVADLAPLRAVLGPDLTVTQELRGATVFSRVERMGKRLWEKSPEQTICPGARLVCGWQGVTDALFTVSVRGRTYTLLSDTMHDMQTTEDLSLLRMTRTYCKDHRLRDEKTKEMIWDRPCKHCRGILRLRFVAPNRYKERHAQLERLTPEALAQRAQLCGLADEATDASRKKDLLNLICKSEHIVR